MEIDRHNQRNEFHPRLLGEYLSCSPGSINIAIRKQRQRVSSASAAGGSDILLGKILLQAEFISAEELRSALRQQRADRLSQCPVFVALQRTELTALGDKFHEINIAPKEQFITAGTQGSKLYILVGGCVEVFLPVGQSNRQVLATLSPYQPLGEMGYFQDGIRRASVRTLSLTHLLEATYTDLTHYFEQVPAVAHAFLRLVEQRQDEIEQAQTVIRSS